MLDTPAACRPLRPSALISFPEGTLKKFERVRKARVHLARCDLMLSNFVTWRASERHLRFEVFQNMVSNFYQKGVRFHTFTEEAKHWDLKFLMVLTLQ